MNIVTTNYEFLRTHPELYTHLFKSKTDTTSYSVYIYIFVFIYK